MLRRQFLNIAGILLRGRNIVLGQFWPVTAPEGTPLDLGILLTNGQGGLSFFQTKGSKKGQTIADVPYICLWYANYMPIICQIFGHFVPKVCLEGMVNIIKLFPLPIQLSHMFVTLALVRRGRVGVMESILGALLALLEGHSPKQTCLDITWLAIEGKKC